MVSYPAEFLSWPQNHSTMSANFPASETGKNKFWVACAQAESAFYDKAHKIDALEFFKKFAVSAEELPDTVSIKCTSAYVRFALCTSAVSACLR
eukprot:scaffold24418_cov14-Tisochrysis_lutea.AAC.1